MEHFEFLKRLIENFSVNEILEKFSSSYEDVYNTADYLDDFKRRYISIIKKLENSEVDVPEEFISSSVRKLLRRVQAVYRSLEGIKTYDQQLSTDPARDAAVYDLVNSLRQALDTVDGVDRALVTFATQKAYEEILHKERETRGIYESIKKRNEAALNVAEERSFSVGFSSLADQKESLERGRFKWIWGAAVGAIITVVLLFWTGERIIDGDFFKKLEVHELYLLALVKLAINVVLLSATVWCARMYRVQTHLMYGLSLKLGLINALEGLNASASNDIAKDQVLVSVLNAVTAPIHTGLVDEKTTDLQPVADIFKSLAIMVRKD